MVVESVVQTGWSLGSTQSCSDAADSTKIEKIILTLGKVVP
jgi:hypothetical protein